MNKTNHCRSTLVTVLIIAFSILQGCSESSVPSEIPASSEIAQETNTNSGNENQNSNPTGSIANVSIPEAEIEPPQVAIAPSPLADSNSSASDVSAAVPDPMVQNRVDVSFEITVPAYQSDALQVQLSWGDFNTSLNWIGDEFWSTNANLPTDMEQLLSIVFYDDNGELELGSYEVPYRSGTNAAESYRVTADQFDTSRWDEDGDGISNLDELIAGTDPGVNEENLLDIFDQRNMGLLFIANYFERIIENERPRQLTEIEEFGDRRGHATRADIDALGNGTASANNWFGIEREGRSAERSVSGNKVSWEGSWSFYDGDYGFRQAFVSDVTVDGDSRTVVETGTGSWVGTFSDSWESSVNLTGKPIEGSDYCSPVSGTITQIHRSNRGGGTVHTLTITREPGNDLWRVMSVNETNTDTSTSEYFARELVMHLIVFGYQKRVSQHDHFFCNFVDL